MEEPKTYIYEKCEDLTDIDMTGETTAIIREESYLRAGISSEDAPVVSETALKEAQAVLRLSRKGDWIQNSILIDGETYTGWVAKSKITQK